MNHIFLQSTGQEFTFLYIPLAIIFIVIVFFYAMARRYKRCPSNKILVVYGNTGGGNKSAKCIQGGATFIMPIFQDYDYLDLTPISIEVNLTNALSRQNIRVNVPSRFTVGVSKDAAIMQNAAERLLGLNEDEIETQAQEIILGQLRLVVASMDIEEINSDRDKFMTNVKHNVEVELKKIGLDLINVNITDIHDESGYIEALGKEAAAKAINDAKRSVAEKNRDGSVGEANALQDQRIQVAAANAHAVEGENNAQIQIANSNAERRAKEAEAEKLAVSAEKVQTANALREAYLAEREAEMARAEKEKASQQADIIVQAEIEKEMIEINAEAKAEETRRVAKGEADRIFFTKEAEAKGLYEILTKQAEGLDKVVEAAGENAKDAVLLLIADKLPDLVEKQAEAIKNIKIDKITVWDGNGDKNGKTSTANFLSGMYQSIPPLESMFNMAGMQLPKYLKGENTEDQEGKVEEKE